VFWNVAELESAIQEAQEQPPHAGGRPLRKPKTAKQVLQQTQNLSRKWLKYHQKVVIGVLHGLNNMAALGLSQDLLRLVQQTRSIVQQVTATATTIEKGLAALERKARQRRQS
jgi:hypothetical protein